VKSILTPKLRRLTRAADLHLQVLAEKYMDRSTGTNAMIGLSIRRGMIYRRLKEIAIREDAIPSGTVQVPPREKRNEPFSCAMEGFEVDLDKLSIGLPAALAERREALRRWRES
jgi:hypothetical protein